VEQVLPFFPGLFLDGLGNLAEARVGQDAFCQNFRNERLQHFDGGDELWCDKADYNVVQLKGKFYNVRGTSPVKMVVRRGILPTQNPFHFEGEWAERVGERYYLHNGWITNCLAAKPWWTMKGPLFDIIPGDRALAYRSVFWVRKLPLFYTPYFYHSLKRLPRRSGLLTPNIVNSSQFGKVVGFGYFWAINRSYDALYRGQYFSQRGIAHHVERAFALQGFATARNAPYAGGYTTHLYARRQIGVHALQIEVNRALYLDEERITKTASFAGLKGRLIAALQRALEFDLAHLHPRRPAAAE